MKPKVSSSQVSRPYILSVDGDIPTPTEIRVGIDGQWADGLPWKKDYINPQGEILATPRAKIASFSFTLQRNSLASPFLRSIIIEGDRNKNTYDAEQIIKMLGTEQKIMMLMSPENEPPYVSVALFENIGIPASSVTSCETTRPWVIEIVGDAPNGSRMTLTFRGIEPDGNIWQENYVVSQEGYEYVPFRQQLPTTTFHIHDFALQLEAAPDGSCSPALEGIAFEGDSRRIFIRAAELFEGQTLPESIELIEASNSDFSCLSLKPRAPKFLGFPSVMYRLDEMFERGELMPDS